MQLQLARATPGRCLHGDSSPAEAALLAETNAQRGLTGTAHYAEHPTAYAVPSLEPTAAHHGSCSSSTMQRPPEPWIWPSNKRTALSRRSFTAHSPCCREETLALSVQNLTVSKLLQRRCCEGDIAAKSKAVLQEPFVCTAFAAHAVGKHICHTACCGCCVWC
jgi:hypothetical protein